jgi:hypothetical protein
MEPKDEILPTTPISEQKSRKPESPAMPSQPLQHSRVSGMCTWSLGEVPLKPFNKILYKEKKKRKKERKLGSQIWWHTPVIPHP